MTRAFRIPVLLAFGLVVGLVSAATQWNLQPQESSLGFVGTQAGAPFQGAFKRFTADIQFDPKDLANSRFDVRIDMASVDSQDDDRDEVLRSADLFNISQWPTGQYVAETFTDQGAGKFAAAGQLTLRDVTRTIPIDFTFENGNGAAWLKGSAALQRLDFGIGQGEWKDTETVANEVRIRFALLLKP